MIHAARHRPLARRRPSVEWTPLTGRELGSEVVPELPPTPWRIVACLNVWNDRAALEKTVPTWYDHVDDVIALDGEYGPGRSLSTDGSTLFLVELLACKKPLTIVDAAGLSQCEKRTLYLDRCAPGDLLVIIDADESLEHPERLRDTPMLDVGWVRVESPLYARQYGQPRLIRWQPDLAYRGRHHWLYRGDDLLATHQYGGTGFEHRTIPVTFHNHRGLGHSAERHADKRRHAKTQFASEHTEQAGPHTGASDRVVRRRESLRIGHVALRDDGIAPSRLHTALNRTTPHASLFICGRDGPFEAPGQYLVTTHRQECGRIIATADVIHYHVDIVPGLPAPQRNAKRHQRVVLHHHGSPLRRNAEKFMKLAVQHDALVLVSNLQLLTYAPDARFLPNAVPVRRYQRLREHVRAAEIGPDRGKFRVAHSPSRPAIKGTDAFLAACARLAGRGYPIEPVCITNAPHREALAIKATCDAAFDAFWLGLQCSGLEAAAMGLPVIAGDESVRDRHVETFGLCPYTFADTEEELETVLARLMDDSDFRTSEAERVRRFVTEYHDESAVALAYLDALDTAFGWRTWPVEPAR